MLTLFIIIDNIAYIHPQNMEKLEVYAKNYYWQYKFEDIELNRIDDDSSTDTNISQNKVVYENDNNNYSNSGYSDAQLCEMALDYYERHNGYRPGISEVQSSDANSVTIHLYDDMGTHVATAAWYELDRNSATGIDSVTFEDVDLNN